MIGILLDERVGIPKEEILSRRWVPERPAHAFSAETGAWLGDDFIELKDIHALLEGRHTRPPGLNRFFLIWARPDDRLIGALEFFQRQRDIKLRLTVVLAGPLETDHIQGLSKELERIFPNTASEIPNEEYSRFSTQMLGAIWIMGNESTARQRVTTQQRLETVRALLAVLDAINYDDGAGGALDFDAGVNRFSPWHAIGCLSLLPVPGNTRELQRKLAQAVLRDQLRSDLTRTEHAERIRSFSERPQTDVRELLTFGLGGHCPPEAWPRPFLNVFSKWDCPLFVWSAEQHVEGTLAGDYRKLDEHVRGLRRDLVIHASGIRQEGQNYYFASAAKIHDWLRGCKSLAAIALLLEHYFPPFGELDVEVAKGEKTPCLPAGDPSEDILKRRFVTDSKEIYKKHCGRLLGLSDLWVWPLTALISFGIAYGLYRLGSHWKVVALAPTLWLVAIVVRFVVTFVAARRIGQELAKHRAGKISELHLAFRQKIERVKDLTRKTVALQCIAQNRRIGERMRKYFGYLFGRWVAFSRSEDLPDRRSVRQLLEQAGIAGRAVGTAEQKVADAGSRLVRGSIEGTVDTRNLNDLFDGFDVNSDQIGELIPMWVAECQEKLRQVWEIGQIPILARLGPGDMASNLVRFTFLPQDSQFDEFEEELRGFRLPVSVQSMHFRLPLLAPVVLQIRAGLDLSMAQDALKSTEVQR